MDTELTTSNSPPTLPKPVMEGRKVSGFGEFGCLSSSSGNRFVLIIICITIVSGNPSHRPDPIMLDAVQTEQKDGSDPKELTTEV